MLKKSIKNEGRRKTDRGRSIAAHIRWFQWDWVGPNPQNGAKVVSVRFGLRVPPHKIIGKPSSPDLANHTSRYVGTSPVVTATDAAYHRSDGIYVVPLGYLEL